jgi:hypothetical protein
MVFGERQATDLDDELAGLLRDINAALFNAVGPMRLSRRVGFGALLGLGVPYRRQGKDRQEKTGSLRDHRLKLPTRRTGGQWDFEQISADGAEGQRLDG